MAPHRSLLLTALAALVLLAPVGHAAYAFGTIVDKNDADFQQAPSVRATTAAAGTKIFLPCFVDDDSDGLLDVEEPLYLAVVLAPAGCGRVLEKYIRVTPVGSFAAGSEVKSSAEADMYTPLVQLGVDAATPAHQVRVFNIDATTVRKADTVYLDLRNLASNTVDVGDIRLSPFGTLKAGTKVVAGDPDVNSPLIEFNGGAAKSLYTTNMVFEFGKSWYLNADVDAGAGGGVEEGDVRLTLNVPNFMADVMALVGNPGPVGDGLTFSKKTVAPGEMFQVYVQVRNPTTKVGSALVKTSLDGVLVDARGTPTLVQNEVQTLVISLIAPTTPGQHKVSSADYTGYFDVSAPAAPVTTQAPTTVAPAVAATAPVVKQSAPGITPVAVLGMLVLGLVALRRRID